MMEVAIRCPKRGTACSRQINRVLREAPAGSRIVFEPGEYLIDEKLLLCDRKNLFLDGAGATLVLRNDRERNYRYSQAQQYNVTFFSTILSAISVITSMVVTLVSLKK